jgi:uncharacterized repeat protein (TIGR01451 family)
MFPGPGFSGAAPSLTAAFDDSFADPNGDGQAARGAEITYTTTLVNNGSPAAGNVNLSVPLDPNAAFAQIRRTPRGARCRPSFRPARQTAPAASRRTPRSDISFNQSVNAGSAFENDSSER